MRLWDYIKRHMLMNYGSTVSENNAVMTYEELVIWAEYYAQGLKRKNCIAILCVSEMAAAMSLLACFAAGVTVVPVSMRYGEKHCGSILRRLKPDWIITDMYGELMLMNIKDGQYKKPDKHPAMIMFTSGTSGIPKGAMIAEDNLIGNIRDIARYFRINNDDTILITRPIYHCGVLTGEFLVSLIKGVNIRFCSERFNPVKWIYLIDKYNISVMCGTPTMMNVMALALRNRRLNSLRSISISGECLSESVAHRIRRCFGDIDIYHVYGLTEACPRVSYLPPDMFDDMPDSVGIPLKSSEIKIINDAGLPAKADEPGILWMKGNVMMGYYDDTVQTDRILIDGWLNTGDIAVQNERGYIWIKGRSDELIIKAGMNIYPEEIEAALKQDELVEEALVYPIMKNGVTSIGLKVVGSVKNEDDVRKLCTRYLCDYQLPAVIDIVDELEKNASGKIERRIINGKNY